MYFRYMNCGILLMFVKKHRLNIYLTLDYELFFGQPSGTVEKCILEPTESLMEISRRTGVRMIYFIDAGYLYTLQKLKENHPELANDYTMISAQIRALVEQGNDCQLHIHPHWEDARYENGAWKFPTHRYKLSDFSLQEVLHLFEKYSQALVSVSGQELHSYRAGGWCLQPFSHVKEAFVQHQLTIDSTVFPGGYAKNDVYDYDFRSIKNSKPYRFEDDVCVSNKTGRFMEFPIASHTYSPWFFWQLYGWGRVLPGRHKPIGDGYPISTKGERSKRLTKKSTLPVSLDGFFARELPGALRHQEKSGNTDFVVIGHPKACTVYSLEQLEKFIRRHQHTHTFRTFSDQRKTN